MNSKDSNQKNKYYIDTHFPQTIYYSHNVCSNILKDLEKESKVVKEKYGTKRNPALYVDSSHTTVATILKNIHPFDILAKEITIHISNYANELGYQVTDNNIHIINMWFNISGEGDFNFPHAHGDCDFAGVFYIKTTPENTITFLHPQYHNGQIKHPVTSNPLSYGHITYPCQESTIMVWRNYLIHYTPRQMEEGEKIVISFNAKIKT